MYLQHFSLSLSLLSFHTHTKETACHFLLLSVLSILALFILLILLFPSIIVYSSTFMKLHMRFLSIIITRNKKVPNH